MISYFIDVLDIETVLSQNHDRNAKNAKSKTLDRSNQSTKLLRLSIRNWSRDIFDLIARTEVEMCLTWVMELK